MADSLSKIKLGNMSPGLNNRLAPSQLGLTMPDRSNATYLAAAENVDLTGRGRLRRRKGFVPIEQLGDAHSLWSSASKLYGYAALDRDLVYLRPRGDGTLIEEIVLTDLPGRARISYAELPIGDVAWTNGSSIGRLRHMNPMPLVTPRPVVLPFITVVAGALPAGLYQVAFTATSNIGESGPSTAVQVQVPENGGIHLSFAGEYLVYMTGPNGSVFNRVEDDGVGNIVTLANVGAELDSIGLVDMPAGQICRYYKGSLLVARGNNLLISEPYRHGLLNPSKGFITFPERITLVVPCVAGVFVCADRTYWVDTFQEGGPNPVLEYGGLEGSDGVMPTTDGAAAGRSVFWMSPRGLVIGGSDGSATNVQEKALKFGKADSGATLFREQDGAHHVIATRQNATRPYAGSVSFNPLDPVLKGTIK